MSFIFLIASFTLIESLKRIKSSTRTNDSVSDRFSRRQVASLLPKSNEYNLNLNLFRSYSLWKHQHELKYFDRNGEDHKAGDPSFQCLFSLAPVAVDASTRSMGPMTLSISPRVRRVGLRVHCRNAQCCLRFSICTLKKRFFLYLSLPPWPLPIAIHLL